MKTPVYLDHHASTPMDPRVLDIWRQTAENHFGNPASSGHAYGWAAQKIVERAREQVAGLIGADPSEIIFTSGATEANNMALQGVVKSYAERGRRKILTTNLEHPSVLQPLRHLHNQEKISLLELESPADGVLKAEQADSQISEETLLVSMITAQNEVGTLQPLAAVGALCRAAGVLFHTDAAQVVGRERLDVERDGLDLVSLSSHKLYGPKGAGALFVRRRGPRVVLAPQSFGGGQEKGLRPGTLNVPAIAAFGEACRIVVAEGEADNRRIANLRDQFWNLVHEALPETQLNGHPSCRLAGNLNMSFTGLPAGRLLGAMTGIAVSSGAACSSDDGEPSPVLRALGVSEELTSNSLRLCIGRFTTSEEVAFAAQVIVKGVNSIRCP
ncbi:MAG: cysteine desulfurase [Candidatus Krumholzibacteriia bacterium]|jgi:cysteine desulfurase